MLRQTHLWLGLLLGMSFAILAVPSSGHAAGFEDSEPGTLALGRAAALLRLDDFMATYQNPANLAGIARTTAGLELRLPVFNACFDRAKDNAVEYRMPDSSGHGGDESFAKVCNDAGPLPAGNIGVTHAFGSKFGVGLGFYTPGATPRLSYGSDLIVTRYPGDETARTTDTGTESPNRFLLLRRENAGGFFMLGAGFAPSPYVRVGLSAGFGFLKVHNVSVVSVEGGTFADPEVLVDVHVSDSVIPRATASVVVSPTEALDAGLIVTGQGSVNATGYVDLSANGFVGVPLRDCRTTDAAGPGTHCRVERAKLSLPFPSLETTLALRYAARTHPRTGQNDPLRDEQWDVELEGFVSRTSHMNEIALQLYDEPIGSKGAPTLAFSSSATSVPLALPPRAVVPRHYRDTYGLRAGGDLVVIPDRFSVRAGLSYETRAVPAETMNIDLWPVAKLGLHLGASLRLRPVTFAIAYAHVFYQPADVAVGRGEVREIVSQKQADALPVNEGHYEAALDVVSVQTSVVF